MSEEEPSSLVSPNSSECLADEEDVSRCREVRSRCISTDATVLVLLADVLQQPGMLHLSEERKAPHYDHRRIRCINSSNQEQTTRELSGTTDGGIHADLHGQPALNLSPSAVLCCVC
jgi:hypothetical protein